MANIPSKVPKIFGVFRKTSEAMFEQLLEEIGLLYKQAAGHTVYFKVNAASVS